MSQQRKLLVTSALPYANGSIHIGHLVEYIQTDIWVRFQKLIGNKCHYMCADDTHGTPIMVNARKQGITPEELIGKFHKEHQDDFSKFNIKFDHYSSTNSEENRLLSEEFYNKAKEQNVIYEKDIDQYFCIKDSMFLPDRFIRGECPKCKALDQYGDGCEICSSTYQTTDLINATCAMCGTSPEIRSSTHYFFKLSKLEEVIKKWIKNTPLKSEIKNKLDEWFVVGLKDWDISRDEPYFGFKIPGSEKKYFYVWLDAPIGYISTTQQWAEKHNLNFKDIWQKQDYEIHHFIGKDILYFHALFWPALLDVANYKKPDNLHVHGFLTVNGEKMSKSRGTFILARDFSNYFNPEFLRYYYSAKLSGTVEDIDLNFNDFMLRVNADVVNKYINIASRLGSIIVKKCDSRLTQPEEEGLVLLKEIESESDNIVLQYEGLNLAKAMRSIMNLADKTNKYIDKHEPWQLVKENPELAQQICTAGLNALMKLSIYLKPVIPEIVRGVEKFLNIDSLRWNDTSKLITHHKINLYEHLAKRVEQKDIDGLLNLKD